jgi:uncharacterized membrane protein
MDTLITILKVCAVIGIADTSYLIWHKVRGTDVACIGFPSHWCKTVQYAPQSKTFGVPNSIWGFLMYAGILFFAAMQPGTPFWPLQALVLVGFLFSLYFTYVQIFILRALCTWCVVSALNFFVMFWAVFIR